jgi:hypothetical protein
MAALSPHNSRPKTARIIRTPRPSKGRSREALRRRDGVRRLRAFSQEGTRAALELPPGPLGVPARSWLTDRSAHSLRDGPDESRARCRKRPQKSMRLRSAVSRIFLMRYRFAT